MPQTVQTLINATNSADPDEMPHKAVFYQGLHCLLRLKQSSGTEIHHFIEILTGNTLKYRWTISGLVYQYV